MRPAMRPSYPSLERGMPGATHIGLALAGAVALGVGLGAKGELIGFRPRPASANHTLGYLSQRTMPDSLALLPAPPADGSAAMARDDGLRRAALELHGSDRYALAVTDSDRSQESTLKAFQCTLGTDITRHTPVLQRLLAKVRLDVRASSYRAKQHYKRPRPYVANHVKSCAPVGEGLVQDDGSYPSARGAVGWAYGLVLAEIDPARRDALLQRGREFGQSRIICDAEWQSDVDAGHLVAAEAVARMHHNPDFRTDLGAARAELAQAMRSDRGSAPDCSLESRAFASRLKG